jgi:UDP-GlcNAc:undecaprenyl-phosphate/decaprenyl-phosphate GlcNAc-1-phosphate transferase
MYLFTVYLSFFIGTVIFSILINGFFLKFTRTLGLRNVNEAGARWNPETKPAIGGISFFIIFLFSTIAYPFFFQGSEYFLNLNFVGILLACSLGFLMGLYDDAFSTDPFIKAFTQITCGLILISTDTYINIFPNIFLNYFITLFWVIGLMNSINLLDNMDGITGIVSISIILTIIISFFLNRNFSNPEIITLIGVLAALTGFLYFNWYPSKMFMGDTGSQFLGVFLAAIGINFFWNGKIMTNDHTMIDYNLLAAKRVLSALIIFALPIIDTTVVVIKRVFAGNSPFVGGKDHTTHHMSYLGLSDRQVALVFTGISLISMILTIFIINYSLDWNHIYSICFSVYLLILFLVLFYIANLNKVRNISST